MESISFTWWRMSTVHSFTITWSGPPTFVTFVHVMLGKVKSFRYVSKWFSYAVNDFSFSKKWSPVIQGKRDFTGSNTLRRVRVALYVCARWIEIKTALFDASERSTGHKIFLMSFLHPSLKAHTGLSQCLMTYSIVKFNLISPGLVNSLIPKKITFISYFRAVTAILS